MAGLAGDAPVKKTKDFNLIIRLEKTKSLPSRFQISCKSFVPLSSHIFHWDRVAGAYQLLAVVVVVS